MTVYLGLCVCLVMVRNKLKSAQITGSPDPDMDASGEFAPFPGSAVPDWGRSPLSRSGPVTP
jgi:hypothetical protein